MKRTVISVLTVAGIGVSTLVATTAASAAGTASIAGTVRAAETGVPIGGINVTLLDDETVFGPGGDPINGPVAIGGTTTAANGTYTVGGLEANAEGYWICFSDDIFSPDARWEGQCYHNAAGFFPFPDPLGLEQVPADAVQVPLTAGQHATGIDADMIDMRPSVVTGTVTATNGAPLRNVRVVANNLIAMTAADGTYSIREPNGPVLVCFDARNATGGPSTTGYGSECNTNVPWLGAGDPPASTTAVNVDNSTATVNARLVAGGAITGHVTQRITTAFPGPPLLGVTVKLYAPDGFYYGTATTVARGLYRINGLTPGLRYYLCFDPTDARGGVTLKTYKPQCWKHKAWRVDDPAAPGSVAFINVAGQVRTGIDETLPAASR